MTDFDIYFGRYFRLCGFPEEQIKHFEEVEAISFFQGITNQNGDIEAHELNFDKIRKEYEDNSISENNYTEYVPWDGLLQIFLENFYCECIRPEYSDTGKAVSTQEFLARYFGNCTEKQAENFKLVYRAMDNDER